MMNTDPFTWWRTRRPKKLDRRDADRLMHELLTRTPRESGEDRLLANVQAESPDAAFKLGLFLHDTFATGGPRRDLAMSWFYLCLVTEFPFEEFKRDAATVLAHELLDDLAYVWGTKSLRFAENMHDDPPNFHEPSGRFQAGRKLRIVKGLIDRGRRVDSFYHDLHREAWRRTRDQPAKAAEVGGQDTAKTPEPADEQPQRRVALADEIPKTGSMDDRRFIETYQSLCKPFPLVGGVDPDAIADVLTGECPWASAFAERVRRELHLRQSCGLPWFHLRPVLLVGPPGTGKTRMARRLANMVGIGVQELSVAGMADNRHLQGTARGWSSAHPSAPVSAIHRHGIANPLVILDEVDKAGGSDHNGRLHDSLLGMLEPETAGSWFDDALRVPCDLSQVSWVMTANDASSLPASLKSRLAVIEIPAPTERHFDALIEGLARDFAAELGVRPNDLPALDDDAVAELRRDLRRHGDVRRIRRGYEEAVAVAATGSTPAMH